MNKLKFVAALLALTTAVGLAGCKSNKQPDNGGSKEDPPIVQEPEAFVSVSVTQTEVTLKDYEVEGYNFVKYFRISDDNVGISAKDYVDISEVKAEVGTYTVTCTYKGKSASLTVKVVASSVDLTLAKDEIKLNTSEVADYDFKALFSLFVDGAAVEITDKMITSDVVAEAGVYSYTVTFFGTSMTLKVTVIDENAIEIIRSYSELELTLDELKGFDFTSLFSLYVGGVAEKVLLSYIDISALAEVQEGSTYPVIMTFEKNGRQGTATAYIKVVSEAQISITSTNIVTYPNSENIDLKTLFSIKNGNLVIEVTDDMISGTVDYSKEGENIITLEYGGRTATAIVTVKLGVIIGYAVSDTVLVEKGTDIDNYDFGSDFNVIINGIRFTNLPHTYFDLTGVDFNTEGSYTVKITVPYNTKGLPSVGVNFSYFEKEITYVVVAKKVEYTVKVLEPVVVLYAGTTSYNVFNNLSVTINGIKRKLIENKEIVDITTCYAQIISPPIDFNSPAEQVVEIEVYVYGPDRDPVIVAFVVRVDNGVTVTGSEKVVFSGSTVYARDLFTISENGRSVTVTDDMVSGKIDTFNAGIYFVTATYKGVTAQSKAVVLDSSMMGNYRTLLTEIEIVEDDDEDYDDGYGWGDSGYYALSPDSTAPYAATLKDFVVDSDGEMYLGSQHIEIVSIVDDTTFNVRYFTYDYVMHYSDGIITLDPDNRYHLGYHSAMRPMVYFSESVWTLESAFEINSSTNGSIFQSTYSGVTTINLFKLSSVESEEVFWYGMKAQLLSKYNSDTFYADEVFGFATLAPDFRQVAGCVSTVNLGGESYEFTMKSASKALINAAAKTVSPFAGMTFRGTVDGKPATFAVSGGDKINFKIDNVVVFDLTVSDQNQLKNAGIDYSENTWLVYNMHLDSESKPYAYKFRLNTEDGTFTIDERDDLFGRYVYEKVAFFFDGYGSGEANFNTDSKYMTTAFTYKRNGANIEITFRNPQPNFAYGKTVKFLLADYKNILTVREIYGIDLVGKQLVNALITDGAIVQVKNLVLGKGSVEKELFEGISVRTKDGELTAAQLKGYISGTSGPKYVDTSKIGNIPGFYQLIINIPMQGTVVPSYYAVQILDDIYRNNKFVGSYYQSAVNDATSVVIDVYGRISGKYADVEFNGIANLNGDKFTATAECAQGRMTITGELLSDGIVKITARGALMFTDCFTTGTVRVCGTEGYILRAITANGVTVCMLANAATSVGTVVDVEGNLDVLGSILVLNDGNKEYVVKITSWGGTDRGLVLSDSVRGIYTYEGEDGLKDDLILDGFGEVTLGEKSGTYQAWGTGITVLFGSEIKVFRIYTRTNTYEESNTPIDETLFAGKTYTLTHTFFCENDSETPYSATTIFEFKADGIVTVKSSSEEHNEGCNDIYSPEFATESGMDGIFTVAGNKITVEVNGKTIVFAFTDAVGLYTITCSSTDVNSSSHGYFNAGTVFTLE